MAVVAAGNEGINVSASGQDSSGYQYDGQSPAKFATVLPDCVLAVAAVDSQDRLASFSNWGMAVGVAAPGERM
jgi:subtilisin family serine protease